MKKDISNVKNDVITHIQKNGKQAILSDFITKRYTKMLYANKLSYNDKLSEQLDMINAKNKTAIIEEVEELSEEIEQNTDYDRLVSIVPAKMLLNIVAKGLGLSSGDDYVNLVIKYLKQDKFFNERVKQLLNISFT